MTCNHVGKNRSKNYFHNINSREVSAKLFCGKSKETLRNNIKKKLPHMKSSQVYCRIATVSKSISNFININRRFMAKVLAYPAHKCINIHGAWPMKPFVTLISCGITNDSSCRMFYPFVSAVVLL